MNVEEFLKNKNLKDYDCYLLEGEILTVLKYTRVFQFQVSDGELINVQTLEVEDCPFGLYSVPDGYIVHGELEIAMYDKHFRLKWRFGGRDIFASSTDKQVFRMLEDRICLFDFWDNYYEIDYNGKLLVDRPINA